ncbi:hypothetical protein [Rossellomorea aquimaris]|uniref:hypothetical protein n=1 Tax=Rossellomorea TaxID=2837508 RepID=UPI001653789F|nr:hypothetical protein [Rossellomorea aquimaris]
MYVYIHTIKQLEEFFNWKKRRGYFKKYTYKAEQTGFDEDLSKNGYVRGCRFDVLEMMT